jgi:exodeoxyribonuclease VII small subunit
VTKKSTTMPSLEVSLTEIAELVDKMEHSELTLEQSLTSFERGITLVKHCQKILAEAEQKVQVLIQQNNQDALAPYGEQEQGNGKEV